MFINHSYFTFCIFIGLVFSSNSTDDALHFLEASVAMSDDIRCEIGCYEVESTNIRLPGFDCGDGTHRDGDVHLYYPKNLNNMYPIVSFLHGSGNGNFGGICSTIASLGFVVVAPTKGVCGDLSNQQMHSIYAAEENQNIHPALSHVDYERVGVMGHSQGGAFSMGSAAYWDKDHRIKATVASHGQSANAAPNMPERMAMMYSAGTSDPKTHKLYWAYSSTKSRPAVFYNLHGAEHMEPTHAGHSNEFTSHFLNCHVKPNQYSCFKIYGDGPQTMCKKYEADCDFKTPNYRSPMTTGYYFGKLGSQCEGEDNVIETSWECELAMKELKVEAQLKLSQYTTDLPAGCTFGVDLNFNWNTNLDETIGDGNVKPVCKSRALFMPTRSPTNSPKPSASPSVSPTNPTASPSTSPFHAFDGYELGKVTEQCHSDFALLTSPEECSHALRELGVVNPDVAPERIFNQGDIPAGCSYRPADCDDIDCKTQPNQAHFNWNLNTDKSSGRNDLEPVCRKLTNCDTVRQGCCAYNTKYGMIPWVTWGTTPESEKDWYHEHNCDAVMGESSLRNCPYTCSSSQVSDVQDVETKDPVDLSRPHIDGVVTTTAPQPCTSSETRSFASGLVGGSMITVVLFSIFWFSCKRKSRKVLKTSTLAEPCLNTSTFGEPCII